MRRSRPSGRRQQNHLRTAIRSVDIMWGHLAFAIARPVNRTALFVVNQCAHRGRQNLDAIVRRLLPMALGLSNLGRARNYQTQFVGLRETSTLSSSAAVTESWAPRHNLRSATTRPLTAISDEIGDCVYSISVPARRRRSALPIDKTATDHAQSSSLLQVICNSAMFD